MRNGKPAVGVPKTVTRLVLSVLLGACPLAQGAAQARTKPPRVKPPIDSAAIQHWSDVGGAIISPDGNYVSYTISNRPIDGQTLVVQATHRAWKQEFPEASASLFSGDSRQFVFTAKNTQLCFLVLATRRSDCIRGVAGSRPLGSGDWLAYQLQGDSQVVVVRNLVTGTERRFAGVAEYVSDEGGRVLLLRRETQVGSATSTALHWVDLATGRARTIWSSATAVAESYVFDRAGGQFAFVAREKSGDSAGNAIWHYQAGMEQAVPRVTREAVALEPGEAIGAPAEFVGASGRSLLFTLRVPAPPPARMPQANGVMVDIWSTRDRLVQFPDLISDRFKWASNPTVLAAINTAGGPVMRLEGRAEHGGARVLAASSSGSDFVVVREDPPASDNSWIYEPKSCDLVSLRDGSKTRLVSGMWDWDCDFWLSPGGRYLVYYDYDPAKEQERHTQYYSRDLASGETRHITEAIPDIMDARYPWWRLPARLAGWLAGDAGVLLYDEYDIWRVDLAGQQPPINLTQGYGSAHHVQFDLAGAGRSSRTLVLQPTDSVVLTAVSTDTKYTGFYRMLLTGSHAPEPLTMGPYQYGAPVKAAQADRWIVPRQSATEAPNMFLTSDLRRYMALTDVQPQKAYNWLTAERLSFRQLDGIATQAVLYKPENFDPQQKYPVIFHYYEKKSQNLHHYPAPEFSDGEINVPWFVSRGYVVVTPDIHYTVGHPGQSAYNSVVAAALYVSQMPWADTARLGLQGHSFGGYETLYLITHSHLFAAAVAAAGVSDWISASAERIGNGLVGGRFIEMAQPRFGASLWERPDLYIENSPIFTLDRVTTPLLMLHNFKDVNVEWHQTREVFLGLRRTGKTAWWLQYDNGGHNVDGQDAEDYTRRMTQFFDHYLKGAPAPEWMRPGQGADGRLATSPAPLPSLQRTEGSTQAPGTPTTTGREP